MRLTHLRQADLNLLVYFVALVEERSISLASKRLGLSQPAMSRALQRLRELFRDDLLVRTNRRYEPTPRGRMLLQELAAILPQLEKLIIGRSFDPATEGASFRLAASDSLARLYGPALARSHAERPGLVYAFQAYREDRLSELESNSLDLLLDAEMRPLPASLRSEPLFEEEFVCAVDRDSPYRRRLTLHQYLEAEHVGVSVLGDQQTIPEMALAKVDRKRRCAFTVPYFGVAIHMVSGTRLIATLPRTTAELLVDRRQTRLVLPPSELGKFRYLMIWHARQHLDVQHVWLRQAIRDATERLRPSLERV